MKSAVFSRLLRGALVTGVLAAPAGWVATHRAEHPALQPESWRVIHELPRPGKNEDIYFADSAHGWVVHSDGSIIHTSDGGATWTQQASGMGRLRSVEFLDRKRGFAGSVTGTLYHTTDGGATWTDITSQLPKKALGFCGIAHVGERIHVVGKYQGGGADYYVSPDGGKTWRHSDLLGLASGLVDVEFLNDSLGFIAGIGPARPGNPLGGATVLRTTDGGRTWRSVYELDVVRSFGWKLFVISPELIYLGIQSNDGTHRVARSVDRGATWETVIVATGVGSPGIQGIGFIDASTGWVGGFFRGMFATTDSGRTWKQVPIEAALFNRFTRVGNSLITAGTGGVLRYSPTASRR